MQGIAKRLFSEKFARRPWDASPQNAPFKAPVVKWPVIEEMLATGFFGYVDLAIAESILQHEGSSDEPIAALICYLSLALRRGHLCVTIENDVLTPSPIDLWEPLDPSSSVIQPSARLNDLQKLILKGSLIRDEKIISSQGQHLNAPLCRENNRYYFERNASLEKVFLKSFLAHFSCLNLSIPLDIESIEQSVAKMVDSKRLLEEQAKAVLSGCKYPFSIITGGPGTGKTYTAGILLRMIWEGMALSFKDKCAFVLAAPTGKAAAQLEGSIRSAMEGVQGFPSLKGQTLHGLLGVGKKQGASSQRVIQADVILIDESSMIDAHLMTRLMQSLKPGARLIMLGDPFQLPPIESGSFFRDLVAGLNAHLNPEIACRVTELVKCLRAELKSIIDVAEAVKQGDEKTLFDELKAIDYIPLKEGVNPKEVQQKLLSHACSLFPILTSLPEDFGSVIKAFQSFRILSPLRQGPLGVDALNLMFYDSFMDRQKKYPCAFIPIMITANHAKLGLFNGEVGVLFKYKDSLKADFAIFESKIEGESFIKIEANLLPKYEYAYCISVHKSQGSEFDHVLMILPEGSESFGREALYTGITRAKRCLELWSSHGTLRRIIEKKSLRHSGIVQSL